jgi:hypothetical protein
MAPRLGDLHRLPCMRTLCWSFSIAVTLLVCTTEAQDSKELRTTVSPLPDEEVMYPCDYRMALAATDAYKETYGFQTATCHQPVS